MLVLDKYRDLSDSTDDGYCIALVEDTEPQAVKVMEAINAEEDTLEERSIPPLVLAAYMIHKEIVDFEQALESYMGCSEHPGQWALDQFGDQVPGFIRNYVDWFQLAKELVRTFKVWEIEKYGICYYFKVDEYE